jgi:hypothetical protein
MGSKEGRLEARYSFEIESDPHLPSVSSILARLLSANHRLSVGQTPSSAVQLQENYGTGVFSAVDNAFTVPKDDRKDRDVVKAPNGAFHITSG